MNKALKIALWLAAGVATLLIATAIFIVMTFDPNDYKDEITAAARDATGRELQIQGDLKLSLFPWLGIEIGAMELSNAAGFGPEPFAKIGGAEVKVKLLPLLKKEVEVSTVTLDGLYLLLRRNAAGQNNWDDLAGKQTEETPAQDGAATAAPALASLAIGGINLREATVIWDDQAAPARYDINKLNLRTGPVSLTDPVRLNMDFDLTSSAPALNGHLQLATEARYHFDTQLLELKDIELSTQVHSKALPAEDTDLKLSAQAKLDLAAQQYQIDDLKITSKLRGGSLPAAETDLELSGAQALINLAGEHYQLKGLQLRAKLRGGSLPAPQIDATLAANIDADLKTQKLSVEQLKLSALGVQADGNVQGTELLGTPRFNGALNIAAFNARELMSKLGIEAPESADPKTLTQVSAALQFKAGTNDAALSKLDIQLDQSKLSGTAAIQNFAKPAIRFQLALDEIDADRYLPPPTPETTPVAAPPATAAAAGAEQLPLDTLRALDVDGKLTIGKLKIAKLKTSGIDVGIQAKDGLIRLNPLAADLYNGTYRGDLRLDARGEKLQISMDEKLSGLEIGPFSQALLEKDLVAGTGNIKLQLSASGASAEEIRRSLNGNLGFAFLKGRVNGVNLTEMIQKDYLKYIQALAIDGDKLNQTVFSNFSASAKVTNGEVATDDLTLNSAQLNVKGRGTVNLASEQIALRLDAIPSGQLAKQLGQFKDVVIPIKIKGTLSAPQFATDLDEALKQKAKARLDAEKQKLEAELKAKEDELRQKAEAEKAKLEQQAERKKQEAQQKLEQEQKKLEEKAKEQLQNKLKGLFQ